MTGTEREASRDGYEREVLVATAAVKEVGKRLREEFHRPGGLPGSGGSCPLDAEMESELRSRLASAFPEYGLLGEENRDDDRPARDSGSHVFVIDPHDGTAAALEGWRGSSVSIGLLREGVPVLGVVYAYAARAGRGDFFAWAEGTEFVRNGTRVTFQPTSPEASVVLISQHADTKPHINARLCRPARYRAVPSIAYRLALVAAGEGIVGVSVNQPAVWDVVAGHALLRAVGYELFRSCGTPVRYGPDGWGEVGDCFGGEPSFARVLAARDWERVFGESEISEARYPLVFPRRRHVASDGNLLDRAQGCLVGQLAGDNLGALVEFQPAAQIEKEHPGGPRSLEDGGTWHLMAGQPTDDSELALLMARSILKAKRYDAVEVARAYAWWYQSDPFDMGRTIGNALRAADRAVNEGRSPAEAAREAATNRLDSQANGALMRVSPLAIWGHTLENEKLVKFARIDAALTHAHPVCQDANALFTVALVRAMCDGCCPMELYEYCKRWARKEGIRPEVVGWLEAAEKEPPAEFYHQMGWVRIAFQNAFYRLLHSDGPREAVTDTIAAGGDTDTNAAIAGALLGSLHGAERMPRQWLDRLLCCRPVEGLSPSKEPRPVSFWPVDCLVLAERLVALRTAETTV